MTREKVFADLDAKTFLEASGFSYFLVYAKFWQKDASGKDVATYEKAYVVLDRKRSDGSYDISGKSEDLLKTAAELCGKTRFKKFMYVLMPNAYWYGAGGEQMSDIQLVYMDNSVSRQPLLCVKEIYEVFFKESNWKGLSTIEFFMPKPCTGIGRCALNFRGGDLHARRFAL